MRTTATWLILLSAIVWTTGAATTENECDSLGTCLARLRTLATTHGPYGGMGPEEDTLLERIRSFDGATPALARLLSDPDEKVAELAAYGLSNTPQIDSLHLPDIITGLDRGLGWLPAALGRMDSDAAAREAVSRYLASDSSPSNQEAYAVKLAGARAIPYIVEAARDADTRHYLLAHVLSELGDEGKPAAKGLLDIARDESLPLRASAGALLAISSIKGANVEGELIALRADRPELAGAIDDALIGIGSNNAGKIFAQRLRLGRFDVTTFRDLAETGHAGHGAGPVLVDLLQSEDWETRLHAARALGYIGYRPAVPALVQMLELGEDVRLNWVAAESLGRISDASASDALDHAASHHWHSAVRQAAAIATGHIRNGAIYESGFHPRNFPFDFFSYQHALHGESPCRKWNAPVLREPRKLKLQPDRDGKRLESLAFNTEIIGYGARKDVDSPTDKDRIIRITRDNMVEHRKQHVEVPHVALRVTDGWLAGSNRGEWGGELAFIGDDGSQSIVDNVNVENIHMLGERMLAITGLAHLSMNAGMILSVERDAEGRWSTRPWRSLPGAPIASWPTTDNKLFIQTYESGGLLLSSDGRMQMAECRR